MKTAAHSQRTTAFTLIELLVCIVCIVALLLFILPTIPVKRADRIVCLSNLKVLGHYVRAYASENEERFPWSISVSEGGTKELAEPFLSDDLTPSISAKEIDLNRIPDPTGWYRKNNISKAQAFSHHFTVLSNEFGDFPDFLKLTVCPGDSSINKKIQNFQELLQSPSGGRYNFSYFINLEAVNDAGNSNTFLFGDRSLYCSRLPVMTNSVNPVLFQRGTGPDSKKFLDVQWPSKIHLPLRGNGGNVAFIDGSAREFSNEDLQAHLSQFTNSFNRIVLPFGKRP